MLNIVICEDDSYWLENLVKITENIIQRNKLNASIVFQSNEIPAVKKFVKKEEANVFLLDIDFQGKEEGLQLAKFIRKSDVNAYIVFITAHFEYMMLAFKVQAFDFLPKPVTAEILEDLFFSIQNHYQQKNNYGNSKNKLQIKNGASIVMLNINDISHIEKVGYETFFHLTDKSTKCCRLSLDFLEKELEKNNFIRCHRAYIVNKRSILELNLKTKTVILEQGEICPIGGKYKQLLLENYTSEQIILNRFTQR